jgi:hypothetical protein
MYIKSINTTVDQYNARLREQREGHLQLQDLDFDTGKPSKAGEYSLADKTYAHLLDDLEKHKFDKLTPSLRQNILDFYENAKAPASKKKKDMEQWTKRQKELEDLKSQSGVVENAQVIQVANR